jgi:hypothetical protein
MTNSCIVSSADCPAAALRPFGLVALASNSGSQAAFGDSPLKRELIGAQLISRGTVA